jgi:FlaA1/EpsC-like NDP-sugar epimerase
MKNLLIVGAGVAGSMVSRDILNNKNISRKYNLAGFLDDDVNKKNVGTIPVLGKISDAGTVIDEKKIDEVIIAIPSADKETINKIINDIYRSDIAIRIVPGLFEIVEGKVKFSQIRKIEPSDLLGREEVGFDVDKISPFYENKTVFVTGAGGSIGSEIFLQLFELPVKKVIAFGHGENSIHSLIMKLGGDRRFEYVIGDVKDLSKISREIALYSPDIVIHAAAHKHVPLMEDYPDEALKNNILGTYNAALASIKAGVKNFLLVSTDKAVNPTSVMGTTKRLSEKIILSLNSIQEGTVFRLTRFGNVLGSRGSVIPIFTEQIENGRPITITHRDIERFFMSVREAARLVIKSVTVEDGRIFILDMGQPVKILNLAKNLIKMYGYDENEIPIVFTGLRPGEKMYEEILTASESLKKTAFNKLFVSYESGNFFTGQEIEAVISEIEKAAGTYDGEFIKSTLKKFVPEFKEPT